MPDRKTRRIAYLSYGTAQYDARTLRMARTAMAAGYDVVVYARWYPGLPVTEERDGLRIVRAASDWRLAIPILRGGARRRAAAAMRAGVTSDAAVDAAGGMADGGAAEVPAPDERSLAYRAGRAVWRQARGFYRRWRRIVMMFPLYPLGWASALERVAEPADVWHGMWAGSLPALARMQARFGGRTIYDSRDIYMEARGQASAGSPGKDVLAALERRWVRAADVVLTVNDAYAAVLQERLGVAPPVVVMNVPARWTPTEPRPDLVRATLGLDPGTRIALYQGGLMTDRGIEQCLDAILEVPDTALCLLGFGALRQKLVRTAETPPYAGRVFVLDPVPPADLVAWTASADVSLMLIQPTSLNHRLTTPQKLFESIAAGVPVVASDLPGMASIVRREGIGVVCDPRSPTAIAAAIRGVLDAPAEERATLRAHILEVAHERYNWEAEEPALLDVYATLLRRRVGSG